MRTLALLVVVVVGSGTDVARAQEPPVVVATGAAIVSRAPDTAFVSIAVETRAKSPRDAQRQNADLMGVVVKRLAELSIAGDARRTTGVRLEQEYDNANGRRVARDFLARNSLEVRVDDVARAGEIADAVVQAGATSIDGIRFDLKDRAAVEREAIRLAVLDARGRAEAAAAGAGRAIDRILKIEDGERFSIPRPMVGAMRVDSATVVEPGLIDVRASVTVTVSMK
ncbi:MAG TPA: SIMPL domain-containing protein [Vicinamibacterales bacterium]|jgi:uncharacterized protein YggE|nr:SIMPL domain-containing protein [Vicinamibacterales bacterium]